MASYFTIIGNAVKGVISGVSGAPSSIDVRDNDQVSPEENNEFVVVFLGSEREIGSAMGNGSAAANDLGSVLKTYEVVVSIYHKKLTDPSDLGNNPDVVLKCKQALNRPSLAGAATVYDTLLVENSAWENKDFHKGLQVSRFGLLYFSSELRAG